MILPPPLLEYLAICLFPPSHWENYFWGCLQKPYSSTIWWTLNYYCNGFLIEFKIFTKLHLKCLPFLLYVAITWSSSTSICSISFFFGFFFLQSILLQSGLPPRFCPCTCLFSSTRSSWQSRPLLYSQVPGIYDSWLFIFSTGPSLKLQICISRLLIDLSASYITNTDINLTDPKLNSLFSSFQFCSTSLDLSIQVRNFRITSSSLLTYLKIHYIWLSRWMSLGSTPYPLFLSSFRLSISCLFCCSSLWPDLLACRLSHASSLLNLCSTLLPLVSKAQN